MPTADGKMQLQDFDNELIAQGFDAIAPDRRARWINYAYNRIASEFPWLWEKATATPSMDPGEYKFDMVTDLPDFRSLDYIYVTTANYRGKLERVSDAAFYGQWLTLDLVAPSNWGTPQGYMIEDNAVWVLPPMQSPQTFMVKYRRRFPLMSGPTDTPATPKYLDEAITIASLSVAHKRTHELQLAAQMEADLGDWMDQMKIDEEWQDDTQLERTVPDDSWL